MEIEEDLIVRTMLEEDAKRLSQLLKQKGSSEVLYKSYREETAAEKCEYAVAFYQGEIVGCAKLDWASEYETLEEQGVPEIKGLWVKESFKYQGIANHLLEYLEQLAKKQSSKCAMGVGLAEAFENLQNLLAKRHYEPDGKGIYYMTTDEVQDKLEVDDYQALMMIKNL